MKTRMMVVGFLVGVLVAGNVLAGDGHDHGKEGGKENKSHKAMPSSVSGIWGEIKEHEAMLMEIIAAGKLDKVHEAAFEIRDMVNALSEKSTSLAPENLENVKAGAGRVAEIASQLDKYGDAGDKTKTEEQFQRLTKALAFIQSQYSPEVLGAEEQEGMNMTKEEHKKMDNAKEEHSETNMGSHH